MISGVSAFIVLYITFQNVELPFYGVYGIFHTILQGIGFRVSQVSLRLSRLPSFISNIILAFTIVLEVQINNLVVCFTTVKADSIFSLMLAYK